MYNKLFEKILDSSVWLENDPTRIVWITLLAAMDEDGYAHFSALQNLADRAKVTLKAAQKAIEKFEAPDPDSGNPDNDGRRIQRVPGGWIVLNAGYYRSLFTRAVKREQTRKRVATFRAKSKGNEPSVTEALPSVTLEYEYTSEFDFFWNLYPVHKSKGAAYKAWRKLSPDSTLQASLAAAVEAQKLERQAALRSGQFVPEWKYAATWLNQRCWEDEPVKVEHSGQTQSRKLSGPEQVERATAERKREREQKLIS